MEFIKLHHEICVETLFWVLELVLFIDLYREENFDASTILIVDQALMPIHMVDEPFQNLNAGENRGSSCHHV
jgi:hypothetical protein